MKEVEIIIDRCGNTVVNAEGFNGVGCADATAGLVAVLAGGGTVKTDLKPDYYGGGELAGLTQHN